MGPFGLLYGEDSSWGIRILVGLFAIGMLFAIGYVLYLAVTDPRVHGNGNKNVAMNEQDTTVTIMPWTGVYN